MEWTIIKKEGNVHEEHNFSAAYEALSWFFEKNDIENDTFKVYNFLKQFIASEAIDGDYGRLFFRANESEIELQKYVCHYGLHDDHSSVISVYLTCLSENEEAKETCSIKIGQEIQWMDLEENSMYYKKENFEQCTDTKVYIEERTITGSYCQRIESPVFLITDIPGALGRYVLKIERCSN